MLKMPSCHDLARSKLRDLDWDSCNHVKVPDFRRGNKTFRAGGGKNLTIIHQFDHCTAKCSFFITFYNM